MALAEYRTEGRVGYISLNNPAKLNALSPEMLVDIGTALDKFLADELTRVAIVRGEGRSFCAGVDLGHTPGYGTSTPVDDHERIRRMAELWLRFWDSPKPVIAQVHGYCLAGAVQLPLCCDLVTVAEDAIIGSPKLPLGGGWIGPMLAHRIGVQRAKLVAFQPGYEISGAQAYEYGFAAVVAPGGRLAEETEALARRIAALPADLLRIEKFSINSVAEAAGFRTATYSGTLWDALAHTSAGVAEARALVRALGVKNAIAQYSNVAAPKSEAGGP